MERYHPLLELAPRDVVARAITREGMGELPGEPRPVYLDMRHVSGVDLSRRFPRISAFLAQYGFGLHRDLIPVRPAAHYLMGGIRTDIDGRTSLRGLYAAGEAACTGVHGANRLASNSLLEGLVFGARAARAMRDQACEPAGEAAPAPSPLPLAPADEELVDEAIRSLRRAMWTGAGLLRDESSLRAGLDEQARCAALLEGVAGQGKMNRRLVEAEAQSLVAGSILHAALARLESRGAHYRNDFPVRDDDRFRKHSVLHRDGTNAIRVAFEQW